MRPRFFTAPIAALAALVLLGATVGGLVLANQPSSPPVAPADAGTQRDGGGTQPTPVPTATPEPTATAEPAPTVVPSQAGTQPAPTVVPAQAGTQGPGVAPTSPFELPPLPPKSLEIVSVESRSPAPSRPVSRAEREAAAAEAGKQQGEVYTWQDGDRTLGVVLQGDLAVQDTASIKADDVVVVKSGDTSIVEGRAGNGGSEPVFRSESGGGLMSLPGGVLLALDAQWDQAQVDDFFDRNGISADRVSELDFIPNGFVVETEPGFPSLELANTLAGQDGVTVSSPNWWREVQAK
jgi:hypothetical protein